MIGVYAFIPKEQGRKKIVSYFGVREVDVDYIGVSGNVERRIKEHYKNRKPYADLNEGHVVYQTFSDRRKADLYEGSCIELFEPDYNLSYMRTHKIEYPKFYKVRNLKKLIRGLEPMPWEKENNQ